MINTEDKTVPLAVEKSSLRWPKPPKKIAEAFKKGGRLVYVGADASGRLGVLDASPPPLGSTPPRW